MKMIKRIQIFLENPWRVFYNLNKKKISHLIPDAVMLRLLFRAKIGKKLNLHNPQTYNEKLQWLKLHDHEPKYIQYVDKYEVRKFVKEKIGDQYLIPLIGVWDSFDAIPIDEFPEQFVLKCTHDSGSVLICKDKKNFDKKYAREKINGCLKKNMFWVGREWPYKRIKPRIICERYLEDSTTKELRDYKFFCFDGEPKAVFIAANRQLKDKPTTFDFFDIEKKHLPIINGHPTSDQELQFPENYDLMLELCRKLANGMKHVRVDFYEVDKQVFFGELTLFHNSGLVPFEPEEWNERFGSWIHL